MVITILQMNKILRL